MTKPTQPGLEYAFTIEAEIERPKSAGSGPFGERLHIPIIGGQVFGPRLTGRILPGGSDWALVGPDGHSRVSAHYSVKVEDGTLVYVHNEGIRVSAPEVAKAMRSGQSVPPSEYYFRAAPKFDVADGPHQWLRETLFVCSIQPRGATIEIATYAVT